MNKVFLSNRAAKVLDCDTVISEFKLQSRYYVHFRTNIVGQVMKN